MIVKNEEKYLRKCLEALQPVLDEISSELIIADTGSTDNTVSIAKEFTDKVYYFEWCDDYSKARNFTMDRSSGEWFMFVDADEILQNPENIIDFFKSGRFRQCDWATYIQRNFSSEENSSYSDYSVARLCAMDKNIRFTGRIHECFSLHNERYADTKAVFNHYGYQSGSRGFYKKARRYAKSILMDFNEESNSFREYLQLIDAYMAIGLYSALKYSDKAIEKCGSGGNYINLLYERRMRCLYRSYDYMGCFELAEKYYLLSRQVRITDVNISNFLIWVYYKSECYEKAVEEYKKYKKAMELVLSGKLTSVWESASMSINISESDLINNMTILVSAYTRLNNFDDAENTLNDIYKHKQAAGKINNIIPAVFELYDKKKSKSILESFFEFADKNECMQTVYMAVNSIYRNKLRFNDYVYDVIKFLSEYGKGNMQKFYRLIISDGGNYNEEVCSSIASIPELLYFILKYNFSITDDVKNYLKNKDEYITENHFFDFTDVLINSLDNIDDSELIIPICEQIFVFWQDVSFADRKRVRGRYYNVLKESLFEILNEDMDVKSALWLEPIIRFRYLYIMDMEGKYGDVKSIIKKIDLPINIYRQEKCL